LVRRLLLDTHKQERTKDNGLAQGYVLFSIICQDERYDCFLLSTLKLL
jgi:hypothetical protein